MDRVTLLRSAALYGPVLTAWLLWSWRKPDPRVVAGIVLAAAWNLTTLPIAHLIAVRFSWWRFQVEDARFLDLPVDLYLGWVVLWGVVAPLVRPARWPIAVPLLSFLWLDLLLMPVMAPIVVLGEYWVAGELMALGCCLVPGLLLARWTAGGNHLGGRVTLQVVIFSLLMFWLLPAAVLARTGGGWETVAGRLQWALGLGAQILAVPAVLGLSAVQEFMTRGGGTPVPFDPPRRLVISGPYAYVRNPMQLSVAVLFLGWGMILDSWWVAAIAPMVVIYGAGFAAWDESHDLGDRGGLAWERYRRRVRPWLPRWRPYCDREAGDGGGGCARLYLAATCTKCSQLARWFGRRLPNGLDLVPAEMHPRLDLSRITYDPGDGGDEVQGVVAVGRALEHINLGWAILGMLMRLPGIAQLAQLLVDVSGGGPMRVERWEAACDLAGGGAPWKPL